MPITEYIWDPVTDAYLMEKDGAGNTTAVYTQEPVPYGNLISQRRDGQTFQALQDGLGSIRQLTDETGAVTDSYTYTAFGETVSPPGPTENPFRWLGNVGYYHDDATGSYYVRARNYAPATGRWTSTDPLMFVDGANLYSPHFVPAAVDPAGMQSDGSSAVIQNKACCDFSGTIAEVNCENFVETVERCCERASPTGGLREAAGGP